MVDVVLFISLIVSFTLTLALTPYWIKRAKNAGLIGKDIHKYEERKVAEIGGLPVMMGVIFGILAYVATKTFIFTSTQVNATIMASLVTVLLITIIGLIDDILGWKIGIKQWQKPILTFLAALPLAVLNAGVSEIYVPLIGAINLGLFYPLLFVPLMITVYSNGFNMLAGYNGLEAGQGIIMLSALGFVVWQTGLGWVAMIAACAVMSLIAFFWYNKYPSKIFPGDTLTYPIGALIAIVAILGNAEKFAIIIFIPYVIEFLLKLRGRFKKESFAKVDEFGHLHLRYQRFFGLEHLMLYLISKVKKVREFEVVLGLWSIELLFVLLGLFLVFM